MAIYAIRDLEKLTGIKAGTIRIWEQRYNLIKPKRTVTNIRYYTDEDMRLLLNIAVLNKKGIKISKISEMTSEHISDMATDVTRYDNSKHAQIDALTFAMIDMDEAAFEHVFSSHVNIDGFERAMLDVIYPFLDKLSILWITRSISPAHEKFVTNLIKRKLMSAIDSQNAHPSSDAATFVLYSPEGEHQELTLLFIQYLLRLRRQRVIYLGVNTAISDLSDVCDPLRPQYIYTILQDPPPRQSVQSFLDQTAKAIGNSILLISGAQVFSNSLRLPDNVRVVSGLEDTLFFIDQVQWRQRKIA